MNYGDILGIRSTVSLSNSERVKGPREGGRQRAWREVFEAMDKVENENGDLTDLRTLLSEIRDGNVSAPDANGKVRMPVLRHYVGITPKQGIRILVSVHDSEPLRDSFAKLYCFSKKADAKDYVSTGTFRTEAVKQIW